jgi:hypothetical protein
MKKQTNQQQKTHGKTTKDNDNQEQIQTNNKKILRHKSGTATSSPNKINGDSQVSFHTGYCFAFL